MAFAAAAYGAAAYGAAAYGTAVCGAVLCVLLAFPPLASLSRASEPGENAGSRLGESLRMSQSAWALSMAEAIAASGEGVTALSVNPAGILGTAMTSIHLTHGFYVGGLTEEYLAFSQRLPLDTAVGASLHGLVRGNFPRESEDEMGNYAGPLGTYTAGAGVGTVAYAMDFRRYLPYLDFLRPQGGVDVRALMQKVDTDTWLGVTTDFGLRFQPGGGSSVGLVVRNAGFAEAGVGTPVELAGGLGWEAGPLLGTRDALLVEFDGAYAADTEPAFAFGGQYRVGFGAMGVALRGGWRSSMDVPDARGVSVGVGIRWVTAGAPWGFDYAFIPWGALGNVHAVSLTVSLAAPSAAPSIGGALPLQGEAPEEPLYKRIVVFYPLKGEPARFEVKLDVKSDVRAKLLDEDGNFLLELMPQSRLEPGTYHVTWDGKLEAGAWARFGAIYRIQVQVADQTYYMSVMPRGD